MAHYDCSCCGATLGVAHSSCDDCQAGPYADQDRCIFDGPVLRPLDSAPTPHHDCPGCGSPLYSTVEYCVSCQREPLVLDENAFLAPTVTPWVRSPEGHYVPKPVEPDVVPPILHPTQPHLDSYERAPVPRITFGSPMDLVTTAGLTIRPLPQPIHHGPFQPPAHLRDPIPLTAAPPQQPTTQPIDTTARPPQMPSDTVCKGAWQLGTACGKCPACASTYVSYLESKLAESAEECERGDQLRQSQAKELAETIHAKEAEITAFRASLGRANLQNSELRAQIIELTEERRAAENLRTENHGLRMDNETLTEERDAFKTELELVGRSLRKTKDQLTLAQEQLSSVTNDKIAELDKTVAALQTHVSALTKDRDHWKRETDLVYSSWRRALGNKIFNKRHLIDALAMTTKHLQDNFTMWEAETKRMQNERALKQTADTLGWTGPIPE